MNESIKSKKILFVISSLQFGGGAEKSVSIIIEELSNLGYNIDILSFYYFEKLTKISDCEHYSFNIKYGKNPLTKIYNFFLRIPFQINSFLKRKEYDLIISNAEDANLTTLLSRFYFSNQTKLITVVRNNIFDMHYPKLYKKLSLSLYKKSDLILTVSKSIVVKFKQKGFDKVDYVYNPINFDLINEMSKKNIKDKEEIELFENNDILLTYGRFTEDKNYYFLVNSMEKVIKKKPEVKLVILGEGKLKKNIEEYIISKKLENNIILLGFKKNVFAYLKKSKIALLSSKYEGFPRALIESLSSGIPVIANNCPYGPSEVLMDLAYSKLKLDKFKETEYGLIVPYNNEDEFSKAILYLLDNGELLNKYSKTSKIRAEKYSVKNIVKKWENIIKN